MLHKIVLNKSDIIKCIIKILSIALFSFFTLSVLFIITAVIISKINFSYSSLLPVTAIILALISALNGFLISRWFKINGVVWGVLAGIIILLFIVIASVYYNVFALSSTMLIKASITIISGAIGGIIGVNIN